MKSGTSEISFQNKDQESDNQIAAANVSAEFAAHREKWADFLERHAIAASSDNPMMETSTENIKIAFPKGLGKDRMGRDITYGLWKGVRLFMPGTMDKTLEDDQKTMHDRLHPEDSKGIKVISGAI